MKTGKKILLTALSATLLASMTSGLALTAFADEATKGHEFSERNDEVFEDFDKANFDDGSVTASGGASLGDKAYLQVDLAKDEDGVKVAQNSEKACIYKSAPANITDKATGQTTLGTVSFRLRSPNTSVELSELKFGIRLGDDKTVVPFDFTDMQAQMGFENITSEWQTYSITLGRLDFPTEYKTDKSMVAFHFFAAEGAEGTLDIDKVTYGSGTGEKLLNDFTGGANVKETADAAQKTHWADSAGTIIKREVSLKGTDAQIIVKKSVAVGNYKYAIIEAEGDTAHLKVETTENGTDWTVVAAAYDGYSVNLKGTEKGFRLTYTGSDAKGVKINRIYLTNNEVPVPAFTAPVIDASTAEVLEVFSVAQSGFTDNYDAMAAKPEMDKAGLWYRMSYNNGDKVSVADGSLVFDATDLGDGYINFKFNSKSTAKGKYLVFKAKGEDGANLNNFEIGLISENDAEGAKHSCSAVTTDKGLWYSGYNYKTVGLTESNPYQADGWTYVIIDIDESRLASCDAGYSGLDMYYRGAGKLYIDAIFFCDGIEVNVPNVEKDIEASASVNFAGSEKYSYAGYLSLDNGGYAKTLSFDVIAKDNDFDISTLRLEFRDAADKVIGTYYANNALVTTDGQKLSELTYTKDVATHVVIDLAASGIEKDFVAAHVHVGENAHDDVPAVPCKAFELKNFEIHTSTPVYEAKEIDYTKFDEASKYVVTEEKTFTENDDYQWLGGVDGKTYSVVSFTLTPTKDIDDGNAIRFALEDENKKQEVYWFKDYDAVVTADGKKFSEIEFKENVPVNFIVNLENTQLYGLNVAHVHFNTNKDIAFKITDFTLKNYAAKDFITPAVEEYYAPKYAQQLALLPVYLDTVAPEVSITTATTATAGDEIEIKYTASDDITAAADLDVTVSVTKDGNAVTLTGNKFTAEEGVYTVTVTVRDANGNEATDTIQITVSAAPSNGLSTGAIVGIVIGCLAAVAIIGVAVYFVIKKKKKN